jgi:photosystem II stability/assembly factor-like uncharacterized protein
MKTQPHHSVVIFICVVVFGIVFPSGQLRAQWIVQNAETPENLTDVVMLDSVTAIAIGDRNAILRTTDAGTAWVNETIMLSATFHWNAVSFSDKLNGTIVGDYTVWTTTDGGIKWTPRTAPSAQKSLSVIQLSPTLVYVGCDSGYLYHSTDTCKTWSVEKISSGEIRSIFIWKGTYVPELGAPFYALTPYSLCMSRIYPSSGWKEDTLEQMLGLGSQAFDGEFSNGGGPGFIVGVQGDLRADPTILRKNMSDTVWRKVTTGIMKDGELYGVSSPSSKVVYVCGSEGMIFKSTDGGDTWGAMTVQTKRNLKAIYFYNDHRGFAVGDSGTILYTLNGGVMDVVKEPPPLPDKFILYQNYPNPFNPTTTINYKLPVTTYVTLKVFDLLGREVATLVNEEMHAREHSVQWNAEQLASGMYFYYIEAGNYSEMKKAVLLR